MKQKVKLLEKHVKILESLPEQGMGYQLVDIQLEDGRTLSGRIVYNSTFLELNEREPFDPEKIKFIGLHT